MPPTAASDVLPNERNDEMAETLGEEYRREYAEKLRAKMAEVWDHGFMVGFEECASGGQIDATPENPYR